MKLPKRWHRALAAGLLASFLATDASALLVVNLPWVLATAGTRSAQAYMRITSSDGAKLVGVSSFAAGAVTLRAAGGRKEAVREMPLPAGVLVELAPGAHFIALDKLTRPLKLGEYVPLSLTIESADGTRQEILVNAEVRLRSVIEDEMHPHRH